MKDKTKKKIRSGEALFIHSVHKLTGDKSHFENMTKKVARSYSLLAEL